jgi:hypothetical protein
VVQEECYRLILAKGGNHDSKDINGCTVTHILTIFNNMRVAGWWSGSGSKVPPDV